MRAPASEVRQKPIVSPHFFPRFVPATDVFLGSFDWLGVMQKNCRGNETIATFQLKKKKKTKLKLQSFSSFYTKRTLGKIKDYRPKGQQK